MRANKGAAPTGLVGGSPRATQGFTLGYGLKVSPSGLLVERWAIGCFELGIDRLALGYCIVIELPPLQGSSDSHLPNPGLHPGLWAKGHPFGVPR